MTVQERIDHEMIEEPFKKGWREGTYDDLKSDGYGFVADYIQKINWWHKNNRVAILKSTIDEKVYVLKLFSDDNEYSIHITPKYIGGGTTCRMGKPLEDWRRGHDLPDGDCSLSTMEEIIYAILHDELVPYEDGYHKPYQAEEDVEEDNIWKAYKVGDKIKPKRAKNEYTVVAVFEDNGKEYYVAKNKEMYSNIFCYDSEGNLFKHV